MTFLESKALYLYFEHSDMCQSLKITGFGSMHFLPQIPPYSLFAIFRDYSHTTYINGVCVCECVCVCGGGVEYEGNKMMMTILLNSGMDE